MRPELFIQDLIDMVREAELTMKSLRTLTKYREQLYNYLHKKGDLFMYNEKIVLTPQDVLDKEFKIDARGYRPQEVDKFLDLVINDYNEFITEIKELKKEISFLADENNKLKNELRRIRANIEAAEGTAGSSQVSNIDLLRRLSQLEKVVYGKDE